MGYSNGNAEIQGLVHEVVLVKAKSPLPKKWGKTPFVRPEKNKHIAVMTTLDPLVLEDRLCAVEASYQRQLLLAGKPGYDPQLTIQLKKDLDWLREQKSALTPKLQ
jgi:hypothetical protein